MGCLGFSMILSNNLNIQFRDNGRVGITAVLLDCRKGEVELWGLNETRHLPTRGQKFGKCCRRIFAHFLSWISSRRSLLGFFSFCHMPPVPGYSVATNHNGPVEIIPLHGRSAHEKLLQYVTEVPLAGFDTSQKNLLFLKTLHGELLYGLLFIPPFYHEKWKNVRNKLEN